MPGRTAELVGREPESAALDALIADARGGDGRLLLLEGVAGIGKTALVEHARAKARAAGLLVLSARADELESGYAYGVVRQWLEREWAAHGVRGDAAGLVLAGALAPAREDATFGILHALYLFLSERALARPLLLTLDDAQWADPESLRLLAYVKHRLDGLPAGVLVAARPGAGELLDRVRADPVVTARELAPLGERESVALLEHTFGVQLGARFGAACLRVAGGNPLYLGELQRALAADGVEPVDESAAHVAEISPAALSQHVLRRLNAVGDDAVRLAGAMSVLADGGSLRHAAELAGMEPRRAGDIARALVTAAILRDEDPVRFAHPIVRRAVADRLTSVERDELHAGVARLLREEPERAAGHLLLTQPAAREWCVAVLRAAAEQALARSAPEAAVEYLRRALAEPPEDRVAVLHELGNGETLAHDPAAVEHLRQAWSLSANAEIALDLVVAYLDTYRSVEACRVLEDVHTEDPALRLRVDATLLSVAWLDSKTVPVGTRVLTRYWFATPPGPSGRAILAQKALAMLMTGQSAATVQRAAALALRDAGEEDDGGTFELALSTLIPAEGFDAAAELIARAGALPMMRNVRRRVVTLAMLRGYLSACLGALGDAELHLRTALDATPADSSPGGELTIRGLLAGVLTYQGAFAESERVLAAAPAEPWPSHVGVTFALVSRARLRLTQGRAEEALADLDRIEAMERGWGEGVGIHLWRTDAALALHALGRDARGVLDVGLERARAFGGSLAIGTTLRVAGIVAGDLDALREAVTVLEASPAEFERARAHVELGAALRRDNQRRAAREQLDAGLRLAQRCGARPLAQRAFDELQASGLRLRRADLEDRDALTPSELRIARHAADGLTNREIAGALYLSIKTVEMHLGRVYRKLGITARTQLAQALNR